APERGGRKTHAASFAPAVQLLISRGHRLRDVRGYTLRQLHAFAGAIAEEKKAEALLQFALLRVAIAGAFGEKEAVAEVVKMLT
ncbi:MAG TPA: hypothetical protein VF508_06995, partial [Pyrinomonadaceae bacterium]